MNVMKRMWGWVEWLLKPPEYHRIPDVAAALAEAPLHTPQYQYISLRTAAQQAAKEFFPTIFYQMAKLHGLDREDPVTNWFANLIALTVPIKTAKGTVEMRDPREKGTPFVCIQDGGSKCLWQSGVKDDVVIREDRYQKFVDHILGLIASNPDFYYANPTPWETTREDRSWSPLNRESKFDWKAFDELYKSAWTDKLISEASGHLAVVTKLINEWRQEVAKAQVPKKHHTKRRKNPKKPQKGKRS